MKSRLVGALVIACALLPVTTATALGHAHLVSSDPPADGTLTQTPYTLTAVFSEEMADGSSLVVEDASGSEVARGSVSADDPTAMTAELPALEAGEYTVRWTTVTADDNGVERGTYKFTVADAASSAAPTSVPSPAATPAPGDSGSTGAGNDVLIALVVAALAVVAVIGYLAYRSRR